MTRPRLIPLIEQFDFACERLTGRLTGPDWTAETGPGRRSLR
ncbi:hypothetical protein J2S50_006822 [Streptomyces sp. DSM 40167]|nr:hypothetical protein [Streptomyces sp. DSM 40167]